jgi:Asp-tRNA(Asn)/Glu-tRNA(Gln) amidotransferase A subunit family amidase
MTAKYTWSTAADIAGAFASGHASAITMAESTIARIRECDPLLNSFTAITEARAFARAGPRRRARGR